MGVMGLFDVSTRKITTFEAWSKYIRVLQESKELALYARSFQF